MNIVPKFTPGDLHPKDNHNIIENLPEILKQACYQFKDPIEQELFLFAALGVLSGCLPNYLAHYDGNLISPHLYIYVLAPYGTGKGAMIFAKYLGDAIHKAKRKSTSEAKAKYIQELKSKPKRRKGNSDNSDITATPMPANEMLFLPADSSKSALIDTLNDNQGCGIIFETEGDTLTTALKQDYSSYSDILRKAFHHEPISFLRRQDREHKEVTLPRLAVILSSTFDQFSNFIPSAENGLVSRFAFYLLKENKEFRDVFADDKKNYRDYLISLSESIKRKYDYLYSLPKPIHFDLTTNQKQTFLGYFSNAKREAESLTGNVNRLALICYRIAMILGYYRHYDYKYDDQPPVAIKCEDKDFTNALAIINIFHENAETINSILPQKSVNNVPGDKQAFFDALPDEFQTKEVIQIAKKCSIGQRTAERFLKNDVMFERLGQGKYKKRK